MTDPDPLTPRGGPAFMRGLLLALAVVAPFWCVVAWLVLR